MLLGPSCPRSERAKTRVPMRKIRDVIRLALGEGLSLRQVGLSLNLPFTTVGDHVRRALAAGLSWPLPDELSRC